MDLWSEKSLDFFNVVNMCLNYYMFNSNSHVSLFICFHLK